MRWDGTICGFECFRMQVLLGYYSIKEKSRKGDVESIQFPSNAKYHQRHATCCIVASTLAYSYIHSASAPWGLATRRSARVVVIRVVPLGRRLLRAELLRRGRIRLRCRGLRRSCRLGSV